MARIVTEAKNTSMLHAQRIFHKGFPPYLENVGIAKLQIRSELSDEFPYSEIHVKRAAIAKIVSAANKLYFGMITDGHFHEVRAKQIALVRENSENIKSAKRE